MTFARVLTLVVAAIAVVSVVAHPALSEPEMVQYQQDVKRTTEAIGRCLEINQDLAARGLDQRDAALRHVRKARGINVDADLIARNTKPNKAAFLKWEGVDHEHHSGQSQDPQDLYDFRWGDTPKRKPSGCSTAAESIYGPYWADGQPRRQDIIEGNDGIYMRLALQVIDVNTCLPMQNARVDAWQANAHGNYDPKVTGFLRGWQPSSYQGTVDFDSIFPGHYGGRATHIHVVVRPDQQRHVAHVGMLYFDQQLRDAVETLAPYKDNDQSLVSNKDDAFAPDSASNNYDPFMQWAWLGDNKDDGLLAWTVIGVNNSDASVWQPSRKRSLFDEHIRQD
ncbi:Intradiol ring-cleavage dioxygenase [Dendryphion nanum]|uniref:Intradiol ring-cleavage dioxygenase n=1 Tax=Dendryphion nanum TaxID=256645 RepID=A0A9P9DIX7_9PLEO|nr:Intradiol ring-cleavage dioxygenase [Dendryphion nanum]